MHSSSSPDPMSSPQLASPTMLTPDSDSEDSLNGAKDFGGNGKGGLSFEMGTVGRDSKRWKKGRSLKREQRRMRRKNDMAKEIYDGEDSREEEGNASAQGSQQYISLDVWNSREEAAVVRKFDRRLVLFVAFLYMLSFLDRSNIGNAKIAGLEGDLNLTSDQYEWILTAFYLSYISFEWMSVLWKIVPPHVYVTAIVLSWGIIASLQSVVTTFTGLFILRFFLGIGEAGFTGIPYYLSFFFKREELALRTGLFISAAPLATSFASSLGYLILLSGKYIHIAPWRILFLVEGFPSVLVSLIAWTQIPDSPSKAHYLTKRQKKIARLRLKREKSPVSSDTKGGSKSKSQELFETIIDPKTWITALMFFCANMAFSSLPSYLPQILEDMDHSIEAAQALSAPPYLLSFFSVILTAYISDLTRTRSTLIIFHALLSASGYSIIVLAGYLHWSNWVRYFSIYPAAIGFFSAITIIITWNINNQRDKGKQGMGFAVLQLVGQCGPLVGTRLYPTSDAPLYIRGMLSCSGAMVMVAGLAWGLRVYLVRENGRDEAAYESVRGGDEDDSEGTSVAKRNVGVKRFVYMI